jgi:hypothetical protein
MLGAGSSWAVVDAASFRDWSPRLSRRGDQVARLGPRKARAFWFQALKDPAADLDKAPGPLEPLPGFPGKSFIDLMTLGVWESTEEARRC